MNTVGDDQTLAQQFVADQWPMRRVYFDCGLFHTRDTEDSNFWWRPMSQREVHEIIWRWLVARDTGLTRGDAKRVLDALLDLAEPLHQAATA
jgi:hypothetical protein